MGEPALEVGFLGQTSWGEAALVPFRVVGNESYVSKIKHVRQQWRVPSQEPRLSGVHILE